MQDAAYIHTALLSHFIHRPKAAHNPPPLSFRTRLPSPPTGQLPVQRSARGPHLQQCLQKSASEEENMMARKTV